MLVRRCWSGGGDLGDVPGGLGQGAGGGGEQAGLEGEVMPHARPLGQRDVDAGRACAGGQLLGVGGEQFVGAGLDQQRRQTLVIGEQRRYRGIGEAGRTGVGSGAGREPERAEQDIPAD